jgi:hypothetical protein
VHPFFTFVIKSNSEKNGPLTHQKYLSWRKYEWPPLSRLR